MQQDKNTQDKMQETQQAPEQSKPKPKHSTKPKWHRLARHGWVAGASITESTDENSNTRRFTATIRGYRNWKIFEGRASPTEVDLIIRIVRAIRDQIDTDGEDCEAFMTVNKYSSNTAELASRAEILEHPISEAFKQWLDAQSTEDPLSDTYGVYGSSPQDMEPI